MLLLIGFRSLTHFCKKVCSLQFKKMFITKSHD